MSYNYREFGIDYNIGTRHLVEGTHYVLGIDEEVAGWLTQCT